MKVNLQWKTNVDGKSQRKLLVFRYLVMDTRAFGETKENLHHLVGGKMEKEKNRIKKKMEKEKNGK